MNKFVILAEWVTYVDNNMSLLEICRKGKNLSRSGTLFENFNDFILTVFVRKLKLGSHVQFINTNM